MKKRKPRNPKIFDASFSTLHMWENNNYDMAIQSYFRVKQFTTRAMHEGKEWHKKWQAEIKKTKW